MPGGRPKGTGGTRKRVLLAFSQKYDEKLESYREKWQILKSFDTLLSLTSNPEFQRDWADSMKPPSLCFGEVLQETRLSRPTVAERLRELVSEGLFTRCREGKHQVYAPCSLNWLMDACGPEWIPENRNGRPRNFPDPDPREDLLLMERFSDLPTSEIQYLRRKGVFSKQVTRKGGRVVSLLVGYRGKARQDLKEAINQMQEERGLQKFVNQERAYLKSGFRHFPSPSKGKLTMPFEHHSP
jgi:hypothetical protein